MSHFFISYSKKNKVYADKLAKYLVDLGFDVWIDDRRLETGYTIKAGEDWFDSIVTGIENCVAFLIIMTPEAKTSQWVKRETLLAVNKPTFPLLLEGENWAFYVHLQHEDVRGGQMPSESFLAQLSQIAPPKSTQGKDITSRLLNEVEGSVSLQSPPTFNLPLFEWCPLIPKGNVTIDNVTAEVDAFFMAKYPVTYAQYEAFVKDNGYSTEIYWTDFGWNWKRATQTTEPEFWGNLERHIHNHPLSGVSWFEALAFTKWLSVKSGWKMTLPRESQWQRSAQGDDDRIYPWGNTFDSKLCNFKSDGPTPVTKYPNGVSPFGVIDMIGNVRELCLTTWKQPYDPEEDNRINLDVTRVMRGGSWWNSDVGDFRVLARNSVDAGSRGKTHGFRICAIPAS